MKARIKVYKNHLYSGIKTDYIRRAIWSQLVW